MRFRAITTALLVGASLVLPNIAADAASYPVASSESQMEANEASFYLSGQDPAQSAPGVNVPCTLTAAHPYPVVLVHGLQGNQYNGWANLGPTLANAGYCVYSLNYGGSSSTAYGTAPLAQSAQQIGTFIDSVLASTGAAKVDLLGHSEGGFEVEYVTKMIPGMAAKVNAVVALAPVTHGTTLWGASYIARFFGLTPLVGAACPACSDLLIGSAPVTALSNGPIAQPGVAYTTIISKFDEAVTPYTSAAVNEPGVTNIVVQNTCPFDPVGHTGLAYDSDVTTMVENALDPANAASVVCSVGPIG